MKDTICKICNNETTIIYDEKFDNTYYRCPHCEYIFIEDDNIITLEEEREEYDRHENSIENEGYVNMFKGFLDSGLVPFVKGGAYGLDFGSGPEPVLTQVIDRDYNYTMDHYDLHYQPEKVYEGKVYDFVVSTEVFEHLAEAKEILSMLLSHVKNGGVITIMTLFHEKDDDKFLKWWYRRDITHIGFFTPKTFEILGELLGFEVIWSDNRRIITLRKLT